MPVGTRTIAQEIFTKMTTQKAHRIAVLDFGGQYAHLIANRIRRLGVYSEIVPSSTGAEALKEYQGIILSGSPFSVLDVRSPRFDAAITQLGLPMLGLCYGHQLLALHFGGSIGRGAIREYGRASMTIKRVSPLLAGLESVEQV